MARGWRTAQSITVWVAANALLFLLLAVYVAAHPHPVFDTSATKIVYDWPLALRPFFMVVTQIGSGWSVLVLVLWSFFRMQHKRAMQLASAFVSSFVVVELIKHIIARPRPYSSIAGITARDPLTPGGFGFPSGHATVAMILGIFLALYVPPKWRFAVGFGGLLVGISRVYLGMHTPLDVLGGYLLGVVLGCIFFGRNLLAKPVRKA